MSPDTLSGKATRRAARQGTNRWVWSGEPVFVVAAARAHSGSSTVAAMLALASAADGRTTLLIDAHDPIGALHRLLAAPTTRSIVELQNGALDVRDLLVPVADNCWLLPHAPGDSDSVPPLGTAARRDILRRIALLHAEFDVIVIDAGARLDGIIAAAGRGAWRFVAVSGADAIARASAYALVKAVDTRWPGMPVELLVNMHDDIAGRATFEQVRAGAQHFLNRDVGFAGSIPADGAVASAARDGLPLQSLLSTTPAGQAMQRTAVRLLAELDDSSAT